MQEYKAVCIGNQTWMAENLRYAVGGTQCYNNSTFFCDIYGKLYSWDNAMAGASSSNANPSGVQGVCPSGWHLPSAAEWEELETFLGGPTVAGGPLKADTILWDAPNTGVSNNSSGFKALPGGFSNGVIFNLINRSAFFLTATETSTIQARVRTLTYTSAALGTTVFNKSTLNISYGSVRCVKDR
jgi:uncharacterized protein (TIGR02145 family)